MELLAAALWPQRSAGLWGCPTIAEAEHSRNGILKPDPKTFLSMLAFKSRLRKIYLEILQKTFYFNDLDNLLLILKKSCVAKFRFFLQDFLMNKTEFI